MNLQIMRNKRKHKNELNKVEDEDLHGIDEFLKRQSVFGQNYLKMQGLSLIVLLHFLLQQCHIPSQI